MSSWLSFVVVAGCDGDGDGSGGGGGRGRGVQIMLLDHYERLSNLGSDCIGSVLGKGGLLCGNGTHVGWCGVVVWCGVVWCGVLFYVLY